MTDTIGDQNHCYQFGNYLLDCEARVLYRGHTRVKTTTRMILLLQALVKRPGHIVGKYELLEILWPNQEVSDWSLSRLISDTRQAIGDDARDLVQTVRGQGFRINPDVVVQIVDAPKRIARTAPRSQIFAAVVTIFVVLAIVTVVQVSNIPRGNGVLVPNEELRIVVLPVQVSTGDDQDRWAEFGVMTMLTGQLGRFAELKVADVESTIQALNQVEFDLAAARTDDLFRKVCIPLGCKQLVATELGLSANSLPELRYSLHTRDGRTPTTRFANEDILQASNALFEHLLPSLLPPEPERISVENMYTNDPVVNQNFALGANSVLRGDNQRAVRYLEMALEQDPDNYWARAYMADALTRLEQFDDAGELIDALDISATNDLHRLHLAKLRSNVSYSRGNLEKSITESEEMLRLAIALNDKESEGLALMNMGTSSQSLGENLEAVRYLSLALDIFSEHGFELYESKALFNLGNAYYSLDDYEPAEEFYLASADRFRRQGATEWLSYVRFALAALRMTEGRLDLAEVEFRELEKLYQSTDEVEGLLLVRGELGTIELRRGNPQGAEPLLLDAYNAAGDTYRYVRSWMSGLLAICYMNSGEPGRARPFVEERERYDFFDSRVPMVFVPASLAHAEGNYGKALSLAFELQDRVGGQWNERHAEWLQAFRAAERSGRPVLTDYYSLNADGKP